MGTIPVQRPRRRGANLVCDAESWLAIIIAVSDQQMTCPHNRDGQQRQKRLIEGRVGNELVKTIPDFVDDANRIGGEIKDVAELGWEKQNQAQFEWAQRHGYTYQLFSKYWSGCRSSERSVLMWFDIPIYNGGSNLILVFAPAEPRRWYNVTALCDTDADGRLFGIELLVYEEPEIALATLQHQLHGFENVEVNDDGLLYITLRREPRPSHAGFGRDAFVGITKTGLLAQVVIPWIALGAATPVADPAKALAGLTFENRYPPLYPEDPEAEL